MQVVRKVQFPRSTKKPAGDVIDPTRFVKAVAGLHISWTSRNDTRVQLTDTAYSSRLIIRNLKMK